MFNNYINKRRVLNKKASAFTLLYGLAFLLVCGTLFIIYNQINVNSIQPILNDPVMNFTASDIAEGENYMGMWNFMPYLIVFAVCIFFIVKIGINTSG